MRTIRFARRRHLEGETGCAESFSVLDWRLPVKADVWRLLSASPVESVCERHQVCYGSQSEIADHQQPPRLDHLNPATSA
jgi:hypothetical protein